MIVVLTGAPGAGKGTQADLLVSKRMFKKISTGDALRNQVRAGSEIGKKANGYMSKGLLVPDDLLLGILKAEIAGAANDRILLDGYPRNIAQAETLKTLNSDFPVRVVVHLDVPEDELVRRLSGRRVCGECGTSYHVDTNPPKVANVCDRCTGKVTQRLDDEEEKVKVRLKVFNSETKPILDFYRNEKLLREINGAEATESVFKSLTGIIDNFI